MIQLPGCLDVENQVVTALCHKVLPVGRIVVKDYCSHCCICYNFVYGAKGLAGDTFRSVVVCRYNFPSAVVDGPIWIP